jgi:hypothetical protein
VKPLFCNFAGTALSIWRVVAIYILTFLAFNSAHANERIWKKLEQSPQRPGGEARIKPKSFRAFQLHGQALREQLQGAPKEGPAVTVLQGAEISLPMPDGTLARFRYIESPIMEPELAAKFPEIKTFLGQGIDDPSASVRFDITPAGFHAQILSPKGAVYVDPQFTGDNETHISYFKRDHQRGADGFSCVIANEGEQPQLAAANNVALRSGGSLRTYRLACAATGEYTQYHGGTVSAGMAAIVTAINRVTGIYEAELAIRLVLVANNNLLVYTNGTSDPYANDDGSRMLNQNQSTVDSIIGPANYDIGHVFSTGGGGVAYLRSVCVSSLKAGGVTGLPTPVGDPFYVDYVAHEMGHQFGGNHTFNSATGSCGGGNRNASTAYEPGSGSTIQAYAGICGADDLQLTSDPYFHSISFDEMYAYVSTGGGSGCAVTTATGNTAPTVNAGPSYTIPKSTPFTLTATGSDPNGDTLTYCWEERDLGAAAALSDADNGSSPLFRSFNPTTNRSRTFPKLSSILNNVPSLGEKLPTTSRTNSFRVTARDNRAGGGGVNTADTQVIVTAAAGPFLVTAPNTNVVWSGVRTVTWSVAGTAVAPVNATGVNILLSTNGGLTFPIVLKTNTPNDGSEAVLLPNIFASNARIKVEGTGNIFFDLSDSNFNIAPISITTTAITTESCAPGNYAIDPGETVTIDVSLSNIGAVNTTNINATLVENAFVTSASSAQSYGVLPVDGTPVVRPFTFTAIGLCGSTFSADFEIREGTTLIGNITRTFTLGNVTSQMIAVTNSTQIKVPNTGATGPGGPYPSVISVSGLQGNVTKVVATLQGLDHNGPIDVDVLLVAPNGSRVLVMSDAGYNFDANGVTLTFDDAASGSLPYQGALATGTFKPTNHEHYTDAFSSPAPASGYGATLSVFNGINPNGNWSLYVMDNAGNGKGSILNGWRLAINSAVADCCSGSNSAPMITDIDNQSINEDTSTSVNFSVGDAETTASSLVVSASSSNTNLVPNANLELSGAAAGRSLSLIPATNQFGSSTITVSVSDGALTTSDTFILTVNAVNDAPALTTISDKNVNEGVLLTFTNAASDVDTAANQLTFELALGAPAGATIHPTSGVFTWTPSEAQGPGNYELTIQVNDNGSPNLTDSETFNIVVNEVNQAPILTPVVDLTVYPGTVVSITNNATDADIPANDLSFALEPGAPAASAVNPTNGVFSWTPAFADVGTTNTVTVRVSDDGSPVLSSTESFAITVVSAPIQIITRNGQTVTISWNAISGNNYTVETRSDFNVPGWTTLTNVPAVSSTVSINDTVGAQPKYYRIRAD